MRENVAELGEDVKKIVAPESDCILYDAAYEKRLRNFISLNEDLGYSKKNLCSPIVKPAGIQLSPEERELQNHLSSFRSIIETEKFANLVNVFAFFGSQNTKRTKRFRQFNLQLKVCIILLDISTYIKKYESLFKEFITVDYENWTRPEFDYHYFDDSPENMATSKKIDFFRESMAEMNASQEEAYEKYISRLLARTKVPPNIHFPTLRPREENACDNLL
jgi:hypothetical protein